MRLTVVAMLLLGLSGVLSPAQAQPAPPPEPPKPGVPGVQRPVAELKATATIAVAKLAYWVEITPDAVWVAGSDPNIVVRIDAATNKITTKVALPAEPCAALAAGFGSLWVGLCGPAGRIVRVDLVSGRITGSVAHAPLPEGGLAVSSDSVWFTSGDGSALLRVDPRKNSVRQTIKVVPGSENAIVAGGMVWVTSGSADMLTAVDAVSGRVLGTTKTGPKPRFLTAGGGAIWVFNQGDGSVTRVDQLTRKVVATVALGTPGNGGDMTYGGGRVWATALDVPLTEIDPVDNRVVRQWVGPGGDSLRFGHGAVWLTDFRRGTVARVVPKAQR